MLRVASRDASAVVTTRNSTRHDSQLNASRGATQRQTGAMSFLYDRPSRAVMTARTGAGMVALMLSVPSGEMPSVSHAKKTPPSLGGTLENFLPISLTAGSSFLDW